VAGVAAEQNRHGQRTSFVKPPEPLGEPRAHVGAPQLEDRLVDKRRQWRHNAYLAGKPS
jgi:hypothetical protein